MLEAFTKLLNDLDDQLKFIHLEQDDPLKCAQLSIDVCLKDTENMISFAIKKNNIQYSFFNRLYYGNIEV